MKKVDKEFLSKLKKNINKEIRDAQELRGKTDYLLEVLDDDDKDRKTVLEAVPEVDEFLRDLMSLRNGISINGMIGVVHGLPRLRLIADVSSSIDTTFLMLSGIQFNAKRKTEESCKKSDLKYLELERRMAPYIDDELKIRPEFLTDFLYLYYKYLKTFFKEKEVDLQKKEVFELYVALPIIIYTIYREKSVMLTTKGAIETVGMFNMFLESGFTIGGSARMTTRKLLESKNENLFIRIIQEDEEKITSSKSNVINSEKAPRMRKENPLDKYMENGKVVVSCPLERFEEVLEQTDLPDNLKFEYYAQMRNLNNRVAEEDLQQKLARLREDYLFEDELGLYKKGKLVPQASGIMDDIDTAFLLIHEGVTSEEKDDLMEEINTLIGSLREILKPQAQETTEEVPNLVYFLEENVIDGEVVKTPRLLSTILGCKRDENKAISIELSKLLNGNTIRDRELNGDNLPERIFYKGRDMKLFYLMLGGIIVVIDAFKGEAAFKKIQKVITSPEFRSFLKEVQDFINNGGSPKAVNYTELITLELAKRQESKKMKFTGSDVN